MSSGPADLLDVNVWLALCLPGHPHHKRARTFWFEESAEAIGFCRITSLALVRLLTQASITGEPALSVSEAWIAYRDFRQLPEVIFLPEPIGCEELLESWALADGHSRKLWTDAYLAAFAQAAGARLVSFDSDFKRFPKLKCLSLDN